MLIDYTVSKIIYIDAKNPQKIFAYAKGEGMKKRYTIIDLFVVAVLSAVVFEIIKGIV